MNLTSTLDSISQRLEERRAGKWSEYRKLVALVCDGKEPDADRIASVLADNERTLDELRHDVQLLAKRRKLRIDMDAAPPLESERLKVEQLLWMAKSNWKRSSKRIAKRCHRSTRVALTSTRFARLLSRRKTICGHPVKTAR